MSKIKTLLTLLSLALISILPINTVSAANECADQYFIEKTLANGAKWDMCWSHSKNQGIFYHHVHYQPKDGNRRMVLFNASIAQIHVPYDDNGDRFHDVSDFGLGDDGANNNNLVGLSTAECANGTFGYFNNKAAVCNRVITEGSSYRKGSSREASQHLKVMSMSKVGQYIYGIEWDFYDDGSIKPSIVATGALQRLTTGSDSHGWLIDSAGRVGLSHMHNFFWRLDFDIDGTAQNDVVQEINIDAFEGKRYKQVTTLNTESARSVSPDRLRTWLVKDANTTNRKGHNISYEIRLNESGQREVGPAFEPFTAHDFYVTKAKDCEIFASHNASVNNCSTNNLSEFTNGESLTNQDIVTWVAVSFYHMPRAEDAPKMDAHVSGFELIPRDWHTTSPVLATAPPISLRLSATDDFINSASETISVDVMANDTGQGIAINTLDNPSNGTAEVVNNKVQYSPDHGFLGEDVFWYTIRDNSGSIYGAKIHVNVSEAIVVPASSGNSGGGSLNIFALFSLFALIAIGRIRSRSTKLV